MGKLIDGMKYWLGAMTGVYQAEHEIFVLGNCFVYACEVSDPIPCNDCTNCNFSCNYVPNTTKLSEQEFYHERQIRQETPHYFYPHQSI